MIPSKIDTEQIRTLFGKQKRQIIKSDILIPSAVLIILYPNENGSYSIIITKRTTKLRKHSGEMSFPGGRFEAEKDEDRIATALRETQEEIGANSEDLEILGVMNDMPTLTGYVITPVVALAKNKINFVKNPDEVQYIFTIPVSFFLDSRNFADRPIEINGEHFPIYNFSYNDSNNQKHSIWGATAHILVDFIRQVFQYNPSKSTLKRFPVKKIESIIEAKRMKIKQKQEEISKDK